MRALSECQDWLRVLQPALSARLRLICFPHAGGSASFFRGWPAWLPSDIEILAVRYPGREDRINEPCIDQMDELADEVTAAVEPMLDRPLALFGHSMGASVAHEVAIRLESQHCFTLQRLFVSARHAPHMLPPAEFHDGSDESLLNRVRRLGGVTAAFDYPELRELMLPALRADFRLVDGYSAKAVRIIGAPVTGFAGNRDQSVSEAAVDGWSASTSATFDLQVFPGDHFYLTPCISELTAAIKARLAHSG